MLLFDHHICLSKILFQQPLVDITKATYKKWSQKRLIHQPLSHKGCLGDKTCFVRLWWNILAFSEHRVTLNTIEHAQSWIEYTNPYMIILTNRQRTLFKCKSHNISEEIHTRSYEEKHIYICNFIPHFAFFPKGFFLVHAIEYLVNCM